MTSEVSAAVPVRIDVVHEEMLGKPMRTIHVPNRMSIDGCCGFEPGRLRNTLPSSPTKDEVTAFRLCQALTFLDGVDEVRPEVHAVKITFGRVFDPEPIMQAALTMALQHLGHKWVQLSFWQEGGRCERIQDPFQLEVPGIVVEPLPPQLLRPEIGGLHLQMAQGSQRFTVPVGMIGDDLLNALACPPYDGEELITVIGLTKRA